MLQGTQLLTYSVTLYSSTYCNDRYQYKRNGTSMIILTNPTEAFFTYHAISTIPIKTIIDIFNIIIEQAKTKSSRLSKKLIQMRHLKPIQLTSVTVLIQSSKSSSTNFICNLAPPSWSGMVKAHPNRSYLTNSMSDQVQEYTNKSSVTCIHEYISSYWREFKNHDIKTYIDSYTT